MRFSIPGKVFAAFVVLILTSGAVSLYSIAQIRSLGGTVDRIHRTLIPLPSILAGVKGELRSLDLVFTLPDGPALERSVHVAQRVDPHLPRIDALMAQVEALLTGPHARLAERVRQLRDTQEDLGQAAQRFFAAVEGDGDAAAARQAARRVASQLGRELVALEGAVGAAIDDAMGAFREEEQQVVWGAILWAAIGLVVGILVTVSASRLLRPLRDLRAGVERVAAGRLDEPVDVHSGGELGDLAREFNRMAEAIRKRDAQLSEQQTALLHRERLATVGRMSAQITHELRNPLSSIGLNSELLMDELDASAGGRGLLESIIREVERLREITEEYLRFARLPRPEPVPVDLNHAAAELLDFVKGEMDQAGVKARLDPDRAARPAYVDPNQLRAALLNLLRNAREALAETERDGHVVVRVRTLGDAATIEVVDDGPGMSEEAQAHLFEPFFSTKAQGTGLGLSMVRQIVDAQGGDLTVESQPGKGTTVRMTLPVAEAG